MDKLEDIIRRKRLQWLGHVHRMQQNRIPKQVLQWNPHGKKKRERPRKNWKATVNKDLEDIDRNIELGRGGRCCKGSDGVERLFTAHSSRPPNCDDLSADISVVHGSCEYDRVVNG